MPAEHGYAARAAVHLGDDALVAAAAGAADEWASTGGYARAVWIIEALAEHASDVALDELDELARRARSAGLRARSEALLRTLAGERGITRDDLAGALVPRLGIGSAFGDEGHVLALDGEELVLVLPNGQRAREPRGDAAGKAFIALAKKARTTLSRQRARLEGAMLEGRTWPASSFTALALHPVLGTLARRLVWIAESNGRARAVRVAEDGSLADVVDTHVALDPSTSLHVAHPIELAEDVARFRALMADYRVVEPFPQLARELFAASEADRSLEGEHVVSAERLAGVARRAWTAGEVEEGGYIHVLSRTVRGATATMSLDPGLAVGSWASSAPQTIRITLSVPAVACPVLYSEVRRDHAAIAARG